MLHFLMKVIPKILWLYLINMEFYNQIILKIVKPMSYIIICYLAPLIIDLSYYFHICLTLKTDQAEVSYMIGS